MVVIGHSGWHWAVMLDSWFRPHSLIPGLLCVNAFSLIVPTAMNSAMPCPHCWTRNSWKLRFKSTFLYLFLSVRWLVAVIQKVTKPGNWCQRYGGATLIAPDHRSLCLWSWIAEEMWKSLEMQPSSRSLITL